MAARDARDESSRLRQLDPRQRRVLGLFRDRVAVTSAEIAAALGLSRRTVSDLCRRWVAEGFLDYHDPSRKGRSYRLGPAYKRLVTSPD